MNDRPAPFTPPDCDLSGLEWMPLDVRRLLGSRIAETDDPEAFRCAVLLWSESWHQVPAGSVPADERLLCKLSGLGRDLTRWREVREEALRGFVLCADGRFYHHVIAAKALEAWIERLRFRKRSASANAARHGAKTSPEAFEAGIVDAKRRQDALRARDSSFKDATRVHDGSEGDIDSKKHQLPTEPDVSKVLPRASRSASRKESLKEKPPAKAKRKTEGSRLPIGWYADSGDRAYAAIQGFSPEEIDEIEEDFRLWWPAQPGVKGRKTDWSKTWKTWVRKERKNRDEREKRAGARGRGVHSTDRLRAFHAGGLAAVDARARK